MQLIERNVSDLKEYLVYSDELELYVGLVYLGMSKYVAQVFSCKVGDLPPPPSTHTDPEQAARLMLWDAGISN